MVSMTCSSPLLLNFAAERMAPFIWPTIRVAAVSISICIASPVTQEDPYNLPSGRHGVGQPLALVGDHPWLAFTVRVDLPQMRIEEQTAGRRLLYDPAW